MFMCLGQMKIHVKFSAAWNNDENASDGWGDFVVVVDADKAKPWIYPLLKVFKSGCLLRHDQSPNVRWSFGLWYRENPELLDLLAAAVRDQPQEAEAESFLASFYDDVHSRFRFDVSDVKVMTDQGEVVDINQLDLRPQARSYIDQAMRRSRRS